MSAETAMASHAGLQKFQKHCAAVLESTKRRFDHSDFGGESQAVEAANFFMSQGKKLIIRFESLGRKPAERKQWIKDMFGGDAVHQHRPLKYQQASLVSRLISRQIPSFEASIMQCALRATPGLENTESLCLTFDDSCEKFKAALLCGEGENMTKMFETLKDAKSWLQNMGKCSEAWLDQKQHIVAYSL